MTPTERRARLLRVISDADQLRAEAEALAADELLDADDREFAAGFVEFHRSAAKNAERLLRGLDGRLD